MAGQVPDQGGHDIGRTCESGLPNTHFTPTVRQRGRGGMVLARLRGFWRSATDRRASSPLWRGSNKARLSRSLVPKSSRAIRAGLLERPIIAALGRLVVERSYVRRSVQEQVAEVSRSAAKIYRRPSTAGTFGTLLRLPSSQMGQVGERIASTFQHPVLPHLQYRR